MPDNLDHNIEKLLRATSAPAEPDRLAAERVFLHVSDRLAADRQRRRTKRTLWLVTCLAAAAAVLLAVAVFLRPHAPTPTSRPAPTTAGNVIALVIAPAEGAVQKEKLADGSILEVTGGSRVVVTPRPGQPRPRVQLERGAVVCRVAKAAGRFCVETPAGRATALGTEFVVRLEQAVSPGQTGGKDVSPNQLRAWIMTVVVATGQVLVSDLAGKEQLAVAGDKVQVGNAPAAPAPRETWASG